jgi:hypothetical protein
MVWIDAFADPAMARTAHVRRRMARRRGHRIFTARWWRGDLAEAR